MLYVYHVFFVSNPGYVTDTPQTIPVPDKYTALYCDPTVITFTFNNVFLCNTYVAVFKPCAPQYILQPIISNLRGKGFSIPAGRKYTSM